MPIAISILGVLGPGDIEQAHQPDEYLRLDRIKPTVDLLKRMISEFCVTPAASGTAKKPG